MKTNKAVYQVEEEAYQQIKLDEERIAKRLEDDKNRSINEAQRINLKKQQSVLISQIHEEARLADQFHEKYNELLNQIKRSITANPKLDSGDPVSIVGQFVVVAIGLIAAWCLDYFLFSGLTTFLLSLIGITGVFLSIAKVVVPFVYISIELSIATLMHLAGINGKAIQANVWKVLAGSLLIGLSAMTGATFLAGSGADSIWEIPFSEQLLIVAMTLISAAPHAVLLFSGEVAFEGKAMFLIYLRRRKGKKLNQKYGQHADNTVGHFRELLESVGTSDMMFFNTSLSKQARDIIEDRLGTVVFAQQPKALNPLDRQTYSVPATDVNEQSAVNGFGQP